ncbi:spore protease YyaC [Paenibacillaceae bacterium WGS1546]|uniref:spore protease YyaC n=1 Tax=Cohnella sp. WGS1546 TaxID=3366810 RepID=UPI00372D2DE8
MSILSIPFLVSHAEPAASMRLSQRFCDYFKAIPAERRIVVVCVGTDRCTGDSLGPLTGTLLGKYRSSSFDIVGTLEHPVHAMNLADTMDKLSSRYRDPFVVGIDACLGSASSIGSVLVANGPLRPGAGVNKQLPPVGDIHVSGIVSVGGMLGMQALQSTRLHLVMSMSTLIARSVFVGMRLTETTPCEHAAR